MSVKINGLTGIEFTSNTQQLKFKGDTQNFNLKTVGDDFNIYNNDVTKLWGMSSTGLESKPNVPAFFARQTASASAFAASSVMTWDEIHFNIGNHFSNGTTFTAPVDGLYFFSSMVLSNSSARVFHRLRKNGTGILGTYTESYAGTSYQTVTISTVYQLNAGDYIDSYCHSNAAYGGNYANFNGFLIG